MNVEYDYTPEVLKYSSHMEESERQDYVNKVYRFLMEMKPGTRIAIDKLTKMETRSLFVEVVKMYVDEQLWPTIVFANAFQCLKKIQMPSLESEQLKYLCLVS